MSDDSSSIKKGDLVLTSLYRKSYQLLRQKSRNGGKSEKVVLTADTIALIFATAIFSVPESPFSFLLQVRNIFYCN